MTKNRTKTLEAPDGTLHSFAAGTPDTVGRDGEFFLTLPGQSWNMKPVWRDNDTLEIVLPKNEKIFRMDTSARGVRILYR